MKWGLKLWCLCDSDTGYCVAFNVYCGSNRDNQQANLWCLCDSDTGYCVAFNVYCGSNRDNQQTNLWCLCESDAGYCVAFNVYCGSNRDNQQTNLDLGYRVVMGLMANYLNKHHHVFADNFFTSVYLAEALLQEWDISVRDDPWHQEGLPERSHQC